MIKLNEKHPFFFIHNWLKSVPSPVTLTFSQYGYREPGNSPSRKVITISSKELSLGWITAQIDSLPSDTELAFHSKVTLNNRVFQIPMIDFSTKLELDILNIRLEIVRKQLNLDPVIYDSGHSFHGYFGCYIPQKSWQKFLGNLLLCNHYADPIVDSRWIGYSLRHGFSALRWSQNTEHYLGLPIQV